MTERTWRSVLYSLLAAGALVSCSGPPAAGDPGLEGTWRVTATTGDLEFFGSSGPVTLGFSGSDVGTVDLRALHEASGAVACGTLVFALEGGELLLSSPSWFDAVFAFDEVDADTATIASADVSATLSRVAGADPVPPCGAVRTEVVATLPYAANTFGTVAAHGSTLYLNLDNDPGTIIGYDVAADAAVAGRVLTAVAEGGIHRWLVGARDGARFYGHCGCGSSIELAAFDLDNDVVLATLDTHLAAAVPFSVDYGEFADGALLVGGPASVAPSANRLARADPDTLVLSDERSVLDGLSLIDVAVDDGLVGLVSMMGGPAIVAIGADGLATDSYPLPMIASLQPLGISAIEGVLYVAAGDYEAGVTFLLAVERP